MNETRGVILFNRGSKMVVRAIVTMYSLRKHWDGPVTIYLEEPYPKELEQACKKFNVDVVRNDKKHEYKTLIRKTDMFSNPPYERTLWLDIDTVIVGPIDEMFDYLDDCDVAIPHFAGWWSDGNIISKRIRKFENLVDEETINKALEHNPAINTGILSFRKSKQWDEFVAYWVELAHKGSQEKIFIADEVSFQVLYPVAQKWGIKVAIAPMKFNVSIKHDPGTEDKRIIHAHGDKHVIDFPLCDIWKNEFAEMTENNVAEINHFLKYATPKTDKRLAKYLSNDQDVTIVTACDEYYVDILRETFANWRKYKNIDEYPVIVFVHGINATDERLDFLKLPNVTIIPWKLESAENHREEMLSAFVMGAAEHVTTDYWLKLDADSYATDDRPFIDDSMKKFAFCGHKWGYSRPEHIKQLDAWAKGHWKRKLKRAKPMIDEGEIKGRRFYHNTKRTISFIQLHKSQFTRFCVKLLGDADRLPAPTQDTYMFFVANRFDPHTVGRKNFKRDYGFTQGKGKLGAEHIKEKLAEVDLSNPAEQEAEQEIDINIEFDRIESPFIVKEQ